MTAVVGILNRKAVAIAADSAVSIGGKIYNNALKIFTLSKYYPIGIMIYQSANFMNTPWETIIKMFRQKLDDKELDTVEAYQIEFIKYLKEMNFFSSEQDQKTYLEVLIYQLLNVINKGVIGKMFPKDWDANDKAIFLAHIEKHLDDNYFVHLNTYVTCDDFTNYSIDEYLQYCDSIIKSVYEQYYNGVTITDNIKNKLNKMFYLLHKGKESFSPYSGLIFVGFGEKEIYPALVPIIVSFAFDKKLKYYVWEQRKTNITNDYFMRSSITPFADTDAMQTILTGIEPKLEKTYLDNFKRFFEKYNDDIINVLGAAGTNVATKIKSLDISTLTQQYENSMTADKQENYIAPLLDAVANLSKEDLAELAESLIYLTYLQKRITFAEENVGGSVDVAIISKGDGFVWIKRKHYFKPELNHNFLENYLYKPKK